MSTIELKKTLIHRIIEINDVSFLQALKTILDFRANDEVINLSSEIQNEILYSKNEIENGLFVDNEELEKEIEAWQKVK